MKQFSIPMAIVDYIPVIFFLLGFLIIIRNIKDKMPMVSKYLYIVGSAMVFLAGFLKATYKLLYCLNIDLEWMSNQFFSNQAIGFLLAGIGLLIFVLKPNKAYGFIPTMALVGIMVVGLGTMDASLCFIANKLKKRNALIYFIISFFMCLCMGYLSSKDFSQSYMNWIAQGINVIGQGLFYLGCRTLDKAGLNNY